MKRCPTCNRIETDDALAFCRVDGTRLISDSGSVGEESLTVKFGSGAASTDIARNAGSSALTSGHGDRATAQTAVLPAPLIKRHKVGAAIIAGLLILMVAGIGIWFRQSSTGGRKRTTVSFQLAKITRLTTSGKVTSAAISPDGKYVAHLIDDAGQQSLWVRQVATQSNVEITQPAEVKYRGLAFSPDGNYVYYTVEEKGAISGVLHQVPSLGGDTRKVLTDIVGTVSFSPDGKRLAYLTYSLKDAEDILIVANADGSGSRKLAGRHGNEGFYRSVTPAVSWSPDGKTIVTPAGFSRPEDYMTVVAVSVESGELMFFTPQKWDWVNQVAWLADGSGVLVTGGDELNRYQIWHVSYPDGSARPVTNDLNNYESVSLDASSNTLVTVQSETFASIFIGRANDISHLTQITSGRQFDSDPSWAPDGTLVYSSDAGGKADLYLIDSHGGTARQLTANSNFNVAPAVSSDGRYVAFQSGKVGGPHIWRIDIDGSNPKELTDRFDFNPQWTPDGQWIVYESWVKNRREIWKVPFNDGQPVQLNEKGAFYFPSVSPDGQQLACYYHTDPNAPAKLSIAPVDGGQPTKTFAAELNIQDSYVRWTPNGRAIVYLLTRGGVSNLWAQPVDGSAPKQLTNFTNDLIFAFDFSRDGKEIALSRGTRTSDVILISNFNQ